ncbi:amidohydrolase family protein [Hydrogenophaga sp. PBL-H3]|uniref:amidohydrolase family protein n=1 Tax=Hydrogenophaga sp. PBL-H3 TaxID=434010 RepID=UPI0013205503|nr:amidohydrolase family protein [Hydrogenophaga sp. PBL-H3]QHE77192.1 amidohydrolase family protein [Hydrogenophaga sp. PBL-H3]QHE81616.1 amidohydrolase family protein [Hydrogenophaga sp. PBL-H3]
MDRRTTLLGSLAAFGLLCAKPGFAQDARQLTVAAWRRRVQTLLDRGRLPLIDLQATYIAESSVQANPGIVRSGGKATDVAQMVRWMDDLDIALLAFAPAFATSGEPSLALHRAHPDRFIPTTSSGEFARWWNDPVAFVRQSAADLQTGAYYFMGEHEFRHYPSPEQAATGQTARDITVDIQGPGGQALFELSARTGMAFQIHYEIEDKLLPPLEAMLQAHPQARVIWCHLGQVRYPERNTRYGPAYVRSLIERFEHLHFDLAVARASFVYKPSGARDSTLFDESGRVVEGWRQLIEDHPRRFLAASDYRPAVEKNYPQQIGHQRQEILAAFTPVTQRKLAFENAWRLITGSDWAQA